MTVKGRSRRCVVYRCLGIRRCRGSQQQADQQDRDDPGKLDERDRERLVRYFGWILPNRWGSVPAWAIVYITRDAALVQDRPTRWRC